jgi:hypothetical protein
MLTARTGKWINDKLHLPCGAITNGKDKHMVPGRGRDFVWTGSRAATTSYQMGNIGLFPPGVKWLEHEADHSPPASAELKNM